MTCYITPHKEKHIKLPEGFPIPNEGDIVSINGAEWLVVKRKFNFNVDDLMGINGLTIYLDAVRHYY